MGFHNPPMQWKELVETLEGRARDSGPIDAPVSASRGPYIPPPIERPADAVPYAELHAHSSYSFLDGSSSPEELIEEAERLGLSALALTDHDGYYGIVRFAEAAETTGVATVFGAELSLHPSLSERSESKGDILRTGVPDPVGEHLLLLARGPEGYHRLSGTITAAQLRGGEKGRPIYELDELAAHRDHLIALTGCRKGAVRTALDRDGPDAAAAALDRLVGRFGRDGVLVELIDHGDPLDSWRNDTLAALAADRGLATVATNNVHYARPEQARLAAAIAAVRAGRSLDELDGWLPAHESAHLRSGREMRERFRRYPGAVARTVSVAAEIAFPLRRIKPALPRQEVPEGHTQMSWLRELVWAAVPDRYPRLDAAGRARIERELDVIETKDFPGYFLIVHDIVSEARRRGILCQGRGSAASSAVCYLLGITAVDAIAFELPFERFLSSMRDEEPDIDVDFDSDRREEIIQYVFDKYGRERAAQVCNVIQYRPKNAIRDMARALGYSPGQQDAYAKLVERYSMPGVEESDIPAQVVEYASELLKAPRHLGIHSGGMVLTERPVGEVVPIEHARMDRRTVIQWDKDDSAWIGLVKFDLLGLGMLSALQRTFDLVESSTGTRWSLATIPKEDPAVYDMLCRADSIGVFQVESRAQMGLLPRLQPRRFYDLAIQIALIRPGPIQGGAVHPFVRRKMGREQVAYPHPKLKPVLERTLGIPVFQEQLMQMAMVIGDCSAEDADLLRRAMGSKRGIERIESIQQRLYEGMARNGLEGDAADAIYRQILAFADFGFAESHSLSFALLVYASSWFKLHHPAAFLAGLLDSQPMGFYSPATLVADARRHGVEVRRPDLAASEVRCSLESREGDAPAVRLGLAQVAGIGAETAGRIVAEREAHGPYRSMRELVRRTDIGERQLEALSNAGAFDTFGITRRQALWEAGAAARDRAEFLPGTAVAVQPPLFPDQTAFERLAEDLRATGISIDDHPVAHFRTELDARGVLPSPQLRAAESGRRIEVAGLVTHRQRPATASGVTFINLEDEHGLVNVICTVGVWARYRSVVRGSNALVVRGMLERSEEGVVNVLADRFEPLRVGVRHASRDFR
ncbi:MAG TPA: error-prone DNA polymerase [Microbacteriaceae bacterium]|nr:error-prone DNA polymerase [Microbacteriaceae bacterium]